MTTPAPQDDPALIAKLAAMTGDEFAAVVKKARGDATIAAAEQRGDWRTSMSAKAQMLHALMNPTPKTKG